MQHIHILSAYPIAWVKGGGSMNSVEFIMENLELIMGLGGGLFIGGILFITKTKSVENDLTQIYVRHKKHTENINKSSKTMF